MTISQDITEQVAQCCVNIADAVEQAGSNLDQVVRVNYVLPDGSLFERCWPAMRAAFASARPEAMMIGAGLSSPAMKIEVTALKGSDAQFSGAPSSPERPVLLGRRRRTAERLSAESRSKRRKLGPGVTAARLPQFTGASGHGHRLRPARNRESQARWLDGRGLHSPHSLSPPTRSLTHSTHPLHPPTRSATDPPAQCRMTHPDIRASCMRAAHSRHGAGQPFAIACGTICP